MTGAESGVSRRAGAVPWLAGGGWTRAFVASFCMIGPARGAGGRLPCLTIPYLGTVKSRWNEFLLIDLLLGGIVSQKEILTLMTRLNIVWKNHLEREYLQSMMVKRATVMA